MTTAGSLKHNERHASLSHTRDKPASHLLSTHVTHPPCASSFMNATHPFPTNTWPTSSTSSATHPAQARNTPVLPLVHMPTHPTCASSTSSATHHTASSVLMGLVAEASELVAAAPVLSEKTCRAGRGRTGRGQ